MKKILLATTMLASVAGYAAADVSVSGDARMGVVATDGASVFSSRMRIKFTGSGTTDGGLSFGGSFRAADANGAGAGTKGSVFISGAFGKISMGDVDSGDAAAVGQLASVGYTGLGSTNSINYAADGFDLFGLPAEIADSATDYIGSNGLDTDEAGFLAAIGTSGGQATKISYKESTVVSGGGAAKVLYTFAANGLSINASAGQISNGPTDHSSYGLGVAYTTGGLTLAAGYGSNEFGFVMSGSSTATAYFDTEYGLLALVGAAVPEWQGTAEGDVTDASISATYVMGETTIKAIYQDKQVDATIDYGSYDITDGNYDLFTNSEDVSAEATSMGLSVQHKIGTLTLTAFGVTTDLSSDLFPGAVNDVSFTRTGLGASYDLGGGASVTGGVVRAETALYDTDEEELATKSANVYDLGVNFSF